jgi:putative transposase
MGLHPHPGRAQEAGGHQDLPHDRDQHSQGEQTGPQTDPKKGTWADFFKAHAQSLWQCDFFSKHIVTAAGVRQCFILAFVHVATRRVHLSPCSFKPDAAWMVEQANAFLA